MSAPVYEVVKSPDYGTSGAWYVLADGVRVGSVRPTCSGIGTRRWEAYSVSGVRLTGGLRALRDGTYLTRRDAAVEVLLTRQLAAERRRR